MHLSLPFVQWMLAGSPLIFLYIIYTSIIRGVGDSVTPMIALGLTSIVGLIVTPTLIMGGEKDWNVPILNSEQLYQALRRLGRETQLIVYPGEHHGIRRPSFQKDRYERYLAWYARYVRGIDAATSDSGTHR